MIEDLVTRGDCDEPKLDVSTLLRKVGGIFLVNGRKTKKINLCVRWFLGSRI